MSANTRQWRRAIGNVMKKAAYALGAVAFVGALVVSHLVRTRLGVLMADDPVGHTLAFTASFAAYLAVIGVAGGACHLVLWRPGARLSTIKPQEPTPWKQEQRVRPAVRLTQSTPVP